MRKTITLFCLFIATIQLSADDFVKKLPFDAGEIKTIERQLKSKAKVASYLYNLHFPDKIDDHLKLLGHQKYKVRKWAKKTLQNRDFKDSIKKVLKSIKDPEILENCREILNFYSLKPFHNFKSFSYYEIPDYLATVDEDYPEKEKFIQTYYKNFITRNSLDNFLKNHKLSASQIIDCFTLTNIANFDPFAKDLSSLQSERANQRLTKYFEINYPKESKLYFKRLQAARTDLGLKKLLHKISQIGTYESTTFSKIAEEIKERDDFFQKRELYIWKFLAHQSYQAKTVALNLIKDKPDYYWDKIFVDIEKVPNKRLGFYGMALKNLKNSNSIFTKKIDLLINSKASYLVEYGLSLISAPEKYEKRLRELVKEISNNSKLEDFVVKLESKNDIASLKKKFLSLQIEKNKKCTQMIILARTLRKKGFIADEEINNHLKHQPKQSNYYKEYLLELYYLLNADVDAALLYYRSMKDRGSVNTEVVKYIMTSKNVNDFILNEHTLEYNSSLSFLENVPGALTKVTERSLKKTAKETHFSFPSGSLFKALIKLRDSKKLIPLLQGLVKSDQKNEKILAHYYLACLGQKTQDDNFFRSIQHLKWDGGFLELVLCTLFLNDRSSADIVKLLDTFLQTEDDIYLSDMSFFSILDNSDDHHLPMMLQKMTQAQSSSHQLFWSYGILNIDPSHKAARQVATKICLSGEVISARRSFNLLCNLKIEPLLSFERLEELFLKKKYEVSAISDSTKNIAFFQKHLVKDLKKSLQIKGLDIDEFMPLDLPLSKKISDLLVDLMSRDIMTKEISYALTVVPDFLTAKQMNMLLKKTTDEEIYQSLVWACARMGMKASICWPQIKEKLKGNSESSFTTLCFAGANTSADLQERQKSLSQLIQYIKKNHAKEDLQYDIRKIRLIKANDDIIVPFLKVILATDSYNEEEKEEALWGLAHKGLISQSLGIFKSLIDNVEHYRDFLYISQQYPQEMKPLYKNLEKNLIFKHSSLYELSELKWHIYTNNKQK